MKPRLYTDADLIAAALADGSRVTICRPGHACGLSVTEQALGTYMPTRSMRERIHSHAKAAQAQRKKMEAA